MFSGGDNLWPKLEANLVNLEGILGAVTKIIVSKSFGIFK